MGIFVGMECIFKNCSILWGLDSFCFAYYVLLDKSVVYWLLRIKFVCIQIFMVLTENCDFRWLVRCYLLKHQSSAFLNVFIRQNWISWVLGTLERLLCINLTVVCKLPFSCDAVRLYTNIFVMSKYLKASWLSYSLNCTLVPEWNSGSDSLLTLCGKKCQVQEAMLLLTK